MIQLSPGIMVQYRTLGSFFPLWPAVVCTDKMAPEELVRSRPPGNTTLVLLMGENLEFRWARTTEIGSYEPSTPFTYEEVVGRTPGLGDAFEMANNALDADLGLAHWQEQMTNPVKHTSHADSDATDSDEYACSDPELRWALRLSRLESYSKRPKGSTTGCSSNLPTPSLSPTNPAGYPDNRRVSVSVEASDASNTFMPSRKRGQLCASSSLQDRWHMGRASTPIDLTGESSSSRSAGKRPVGSIPFQQPSAFDSTFNGLDRSQKEPTSDTVEGELSESKEFVQVLVGPNEEVSTLHKQSIWNRPYFRDPRRGINFFNHNDDGMWELRHPDLVDIEPEDFVFAAEYLESGGFGHRHPQGGKEMEEALAQCTSAWITAEKLGMADLMDDIVEKLERLEQPDLQVILVFASHVYDSQDTALLSQEKLKDYLAVYIAEHLWIYLGDDDLRSNFIERLQQLPELERDIYQRRIPVLNERTDGHQEDSDIDMD